MPSILKPSKTIRLFLKVFAILLFGNKLIAQSQTFTTAGTTSWTCPAGVTSINVEAWGGGGGGGSIGNGWKGAVGGGGGGAYASSIISVTPGVIYDIVVGTGGAEHTNGGNSTFNSTAVVAAGGSGALLNLTAGGAGGTTLSSIGTIKWSGGSGAPGLGYNSGGGGGGAGSNAAGENASGIIAGTGTTSYGGAGGAGVTVDSDGNGGFLIGGGGSGAVRTTSNIKNGGSGANGQVIISWCIATTTSANAATTTWSATKGVGSWSNGLPTKIKALVFNGDYPSTNDIEGCSCLVKADKKVTINPLHTLTITNGVTVEPGGTLIFKSDLTLPLSSSASLVQINNVSNTGAISYERMTNTAVTSTDYTYWSSLVSAQTLGDVSKNLSLSNNYYSFDTPSEDWKQESTGTLMAAGIGYAVGGPKSTTTPTPYLASFNGVPNNGDYSITGINPDKLYLIGNPYPSALDADQFLNDNSGVLDGTLYFWTHNTGLQDRNLIGNNTDGSPKAGSGALAYTQDDYASYNITGGVLTIAAKSGGVKPSGKIASCQGFFASSKTALSGSSIVFNNNMRVAGGASGINNSLFFKTSDTKAIATSIEKHRIWLDLSNDQGAFKQTLVGYITDATDEYDDRFDGMSFDGNAFVDFYSVNQDKNLVIQGRALPFDKNDTVPLGFRTTIDGAFTINIDQADGLLTEQAVFIEDKLTNTVFNLKNGDYTFSTVAGTFDERFVLRYTDNTAKTLSATDFATQGHPILVSNKNKQIKIISPVETIGKVLVYDAAGKQIYQKTDVNSNEVSIYNLVAEHQVLLVKTTLQNGNAFTNKIIY